MVGYYQTWSARWAGSGANLDLAKIPGVHIYTRCMGQQMAVQCSPVQCVSSSIAEHYPTSRPAVCPLAAYVNVVVVSFVKPDCTYTKGSLAFSGTGLDFSSTGEVVRDAIKTLKASNPNVRVLLAVGGATYTNFANMNTQAIRDIVDDFGYDGVDLDYEPAASCTSGGGTVSCATDAESVVVTAALRAALPKGQYILSTASWHVGMYGEGAFANAKPGSAYTGVNLAMAKSSAGQELDLINIMTVRCAWGV